MRKIVIFPLAEQDLEDIVEYLIQFHAATALKKYDRITEAIRQLPQFPHKCEEYGQGRYRDVYRRLAVDEYLVFYVVTEEAIEIRRILHGKRDIKKHL